MLNILLNTLNVVSARIFMPKTGVWLADLDVDLDVSGVVPVGKAVLTIGTTLLLGTIDPRQTGKFGSKARVMLVGGGGGWDKLVPALHLHNDVAVMSTAVYSATAATVGEVVVDSIPKRLGIDFVRSAGPASRVLAGVDWYVNVAGITIVGPRVPIPFNPLSVDILEWDPCTRRAILASDELVQPGTILVDLRFGTATVRDVEQTFDASGSRTIAWCDTSDIPAVPGTPATEVAGHRLVRALGALARESTASAFLKHYKYRVAIQGADKRLTLQSTDILGPVPMILQQVTMWPGLPGASSLLVPGTEVIVAFLNGDPTKPAVVGFASTPMPLETKLEAARIALGSIATDPVAKAPGVLAAILAIETYIAAVAIVDPLTAPAAGIAGPALAAAALLVPSPKTFTD